MIRLRGWLDARGLWDDSKQASLQEEAEAHIAAAVQRASDIEALPPTEFFKNMYKTMPPNLQQQMSTMRTSSLGRNPETADQSAVS
jgi:TPP-dependent pyruvate/acetoin dehydrogenase alpha subunit